MEDLGTKSTFNINSLLAKRLEGIKVTVNPNLFGFDGKMVALNACPFCGRKLRVFRDKPGGRCPNRQCRYFTKKIN